MKKYFNLTALCTLLYVMLMVSCKSDFQVAPEVTSTDSVKNQLKTPKVLVLIVDGARGQSVRESSPVNINALTAKSTYSWVSLSDEDATAEGAWSSMFTGVDKEKHGVLTSDFSTNNFAAYPLVFQRIKEARPETRIATYSFTNSFSDHLNTGTDVSQSFTTDQGVQTAVINEISNANASIVVGIYGAVNVAGQTYGYDSSIPEYKTAILQFDTYVGGAMAALRARPNYSKENWLVIVTSSRGGDYAAAPVGDGTVFSNPKANTFTIMYNEDYNLNYVDKPYLGNKYEGSFINFTGGSKAASTGSIKAEIVPDGARADAQEFFNLANKEYTIEFKLKKNPVTVGSTNFTYNWPPFFAKKAQKPAGPGWMFNFEGLPWRFQIGSNAPTANQYVNGANIADANWHTIAVKVYNEGGKRYLSSFTDGIKNNTTTIPSTFVEVDDPTAAVVIGYIYGGSKDNTNPFNGYISDIRLWVAPLPDATIAQYACDVVVTSDHPNFTQLAGYWPGNDGTGNKIKDKGTLGNDFTITTGGNTYPYVPGTTIASPVWTPITSIVCPLSSTNIATTVPNSRDIAPQLLSWFGIAVKDTWKLDGRVFLNKIGA